MKPSIEKLRLKRQKATAIFERVSASLRQTIIECQDFVTASETKIEKLSKEIAAEHGNIDAAKSEIEAMNKTLEKMSSLY